MKNSELGDSEQWSDYWYWHFYEHHKYHSKCTSTGFNSFSKGWSSPNNLVLESDGSPLPSGKITKMESSWNVSLIPIGCLFGNIIAGIVNNYFGRKCPLIAMSVPSIVRYNALNVKDSLI